MYGFRETMLAYYNAVWKLGCKLHEAFATDLGIEADFFEDKMDRPLATLRLLHYPERPAALDEEGQLGAGEHTDYGCVTLLATDEVGGLEVRTRDGRWLAAPFIPGAYVCNIGDCLMRWSNDVYQSTPHRVRPPEQERYSIAFFLEVDPDATVDPRDTLPDQTPRYPPVTCAEYLTARLNATYEHRQEGGD